MAEPAGPVPELRERRPDGGLGLYAQVMEPRAGLLGTPLLLPLLRDWLDRDEGGGGRG